MFAFLKYLRRRPEGERRAIAIVLALVLTGFVVLAWLATLPVSLDTAREPEQRFADAQKRGGPFAEVRNAFTEFLVSVREALRTGKATYYPPPPAAPQEKQ